MSAPTVTRPSTTVVEETAHVKSAIDWAAYARYGLIAAVVLGAAGVIGTFVVNNGEQNREAKVRGEWDVVFKGLKDKKKIEERIEALESIAQNDKIKGTSAHGYAVMQLAGLHFDLAQNSKKPQNERAAAIERAIALYDFIAKTEPFKSNPSFGPFAVRNLALAYEQAQTQLTGTEHFDKAINFLSESLYQGKGENAAPVAAMQAHYLFDPMRAQLGRLYWLRAQRKDAAAAKADLDSARFYINKALEIPASADEKDAMRYPQYRTGKSTAAWRTEAAYLKSLLDSAGKLLPDGKAPAMKEEKKADEKADASKPGEVKKDEVKKVEPPKADAKPVEPKQDEPKKEEPKKEEKKAGSAPTPIGQNAPILASRGVENDDAPPSGSEHLTYAQMQQLLKAGKPSMCLCPRCANGLKSIGAKLAE